MTMATAVVFPCCGSGNSVYCRGTHTDNSFGSIVCSLQHLQEHAGVRSGHVITTTARSKLSCLKLFLPGNLKHA